jgi:hypothetical protein
MQKKEEDVSRFFNRINYHDKPEDLGIILKDFLKEILNVHFHLTYPEISTVIKRKHIDPEAKERIILICTLLEGSEYRPRKPDRKEIKHIKKELREVIRKICPAPINPKKPGIFSEFAEKLRTKKKKQESALQYIEKKKEKLAKEIKDNFSKKILANLEQDHEYKQIQKFIHTSLKINITKTQIIKELREIGFNKEKVAYAFKSLGR